jgi:hypothetical protein
MGIGKIKDLTIKEAPSASRWAAIDSPQAPETVTPVTVIPEKYKQGSDQRAQAEINIAHALSGATPEVAAEVCRRAIVDDYFSADERLGVDEGCKAYIYHLEAIRRECRQQ